MRTVCEYLFCRGGAVIFFYFLVGIMPLTRHLIWGRFVGDLTVFKYIGGICVLYAALRLATCRVLPPYFRTWQARFFLILYLIATISYFTKSLPGAGELSPFLSYTSFLLLFFVTVTVIDSLYAMRWVLLVSVASVSLASVYVIREWQKYHSLYAGFRPGWVAGDPNYFTMSAVLTLPIAFHLMLARRRHWERFFCLGCSLVTLVAVTLGASRGGFLGLVAGLLFLVWHSRQRLRNLAVAGALILPLTVISSVSPVERFMHPVRGDIEAEESRTALWNAGLRMVKAHPLVGIGLGNFKLLVQQYVDNAEIDPHVAHSSYVELAAEMGLPGLFAFLGVLWCSFRTLGRVRRLSSGPLLLRQAALGMQSGLVAYAVATIFISAQYQKIFWLMIFISMCLPFVAAATIRQREVADLHAGVHVETAELMEANL